MGQNKSKKHIAGKIGQTDPADTFQENIELGNGFLIGGASNNVQPRLSPKNLPPPPLTERAHPYQHYNSVVIPPPHPDPLPA